MQYKRYCPSSINIKTHPHLKFVSMCWQTVDGVLIPEGHRSFDLRCQNYLKKLVGYTGAKIVLSSSKRKDTLEATKEYLSEEGFILCDQLVGITIRAYKYLSKTKKVHLSIPRGVEIKQWIDTHIHSDNGSGYKEKVLGVDYNYVILDDAADMLLEQRDNYVQVCSIFGLAEEDIFKASKLLGYYYD